MGTRSRQQRCGLVHVSLGDPGAETRSGVWSYQPGTIKYIGEDYLTKNWLHCRHAAMQIDADGSVWVLPPESRTIATRPPPQPPGYPVKPDKTQ
jgi:hypothetical protein